MSTILILALCFAPAPFLKDRDELPDSMVGQWEVRWGTGTHYDITFNRDGSYSAVPFGGHGTWTMRGRTLHVSESLVYNRESVCRWSVKLDRQMCGMLENNPNQISVRFRRVR